MRNYNALYVPFMRAIMALIFCSQGLSMAIAQEEEREYVPFVEEGKVWYCGHAHSKDDHFPRSPEDPEGLGIDCIFTMSGDTLINGREYKKVYCQFMEYYGDESQHYYCAVREENYQVFIIEEETIEEKLIYDFSRPNEIITMTYNDYQFVRTEGERSFQDLLPGQLGYLICKFTENGEIDYSHGPSYWIDGVGDGGNNPFAFEPSFIATYSGYKFGVRIGTITCMKDGEYIYNLSWMVLPSEDSIDEKEYTYNSPKESTLYDLQGRRLSSTPQKGVYIRGGRKYVVR